MSAPNEFSRKPARIDFGLRKAWIEALRSGKYKQGVGCLHQNDEFCVLGVLVDVFLKKYPKMLKVNKDTRGRVVYIDGDDKQVVHVPRIVLEMAGLHSMDGQLSERLKSIYGNLFDDWTEVSLATLNDRHISFNELANVIADPKNHAFVS